MDCKVELGDLMPGSGVPDGPDTVGQSPYIPCGGEHEDISLKNWGLKYVDKNGILRHKFRQSISTTSNTSFFQRRKETVSLIRTQRPESATEVSEKMQKLCLGLRSSSTDTGTEFSVEDGELVHCTVQETSIPRHNPALMAIFQKTTVTVSNLANEVSAEELQYFCSRFGTVAGCRILELTPGIHSGMAVADFLHREQAETFIRECQRQPVILRDRPLTVYIAEAVPKPLLTSMLYKPAISACGSSSGKGQISIRPEIHFLETSVQNHIPIAAPRRSLHARISAPYQTERPFRRGESLGSGSSGRWKKHGMKTQIELDEELKQYKVAPPVVKTHIELDVGSKQYKVAPPVVKNEADF